MLVPAAPSLVTVTGTRVQTDEPPMEDPPPMEGGPPRGGLVPSPEELALQLPLEVVELARPPLVLLPSSVVGLPPIPLSVLLRSI